MRTCVIDCMSTCLKIKLWMINDGDDGDDDMMFKQASEQEN